MNTKKVIKLGKETDWGTKFGLYAMNDATKLFENTSWTEGMVAEIFDTNEDDAASDRFDEFKNKGGSVEFLLYDCEHYFAGFVYADEEPTKRVYRFHAHSWVDVVVEVQKGMTDDECLEVAMEKYNNCDYATDSSNFELGDVEEITDYLKSNKIFPFNEQLVQYL